MTPTQRGRLETLLKQINDHAIQVNRMLYCREHEAALRHNQMIIELRQAASELVGSTM